MEIDPGYVDAHFHRALSLLVLGEFAAGWDEYEWRWAAIGDAKGARPNLPIPDWNGEGALAGKGDLQYLYIEQGFGDAIRRCSRAMRRCWRSTRRPRPVLRAAAHARALLTGMPGVTVGIPGEQGPMCEYVSALLSLPRIFKTDLGSIPADVPYIHAQPERVAKWQARAFPRDGRLKVGLVWAGGSAFSGDHARTIAFEQFAPLLSGDSRVCYVSLHAELREDDAALMAAHPRDHSLPARSYRTFRRTPPR